MKRLILMELPLTGLTLVERQRIGDTRGFFSRLFCADELASAGWEKPILQINLSCTAKRGTVRGMHFQQPPHAEMKLVSCVRGAVYDVAVDVRADSPTFLQWHAEYLSAENGRTLLIPEGFAHGFQTLNDEVELLYCHSAAYCPTAEAGLNPLDTRLAIPWPLDVIDLSPRDVAHLPIDIKFQGVRL